jgi:hypothetical protein
MQEPKDNQSDFEIQVNLYRSIAQGFFFDGAGVGEGKIIGWLIFDWMVFETFTYAK